MAEVEFDFGLLDSLIQDRGECVIHEKGISCPGCRNEDPYASMIEHEGKPITTMNGNVGCQQCFGLGYIYRDARNILGMFTSIQTGANRSLLDAGWALPGDAVFSPSLRECPLSDFDRITLPVAVPVGSGHVIWRGAGTKGTNKLNNTGLAHNEDRLFYRAECPIWCEDQFGHTYNEGTDYVLDGKIIRWVGNRPRPNTTYVFKYRAFVEWMVFATPMTRVDRARSLAQKVLVRKTHTDFLNAHQVDTVEKRIAHEGSFTTKFTV